MTTATRDRVAGAHKPALLASQGPGWLRRLALGIRPRAYPATLEALADAYPRLFSGRRFDEWNRLFDPGAIVAGTDTSGRVRVVHIGRSVRSHKAFAARHRELSEVWRNVAIQRFGAIGMVSADYELRTEVETRTGKDVLLTLGDDNGWRIVSLTYFEQSRRYARDAGATPHTAISTARRSKQDQARLRLTAGIADAYVVEAIERFATGTVLDVGCGQRQYEALFTQRGCRYLGLDHPRSRNAPAMADVQGDALNLPVRSGACDTIVSFQVLEHVPEPARMVREMVSALKTGGHLILSAPHIWGLHEEPHDYFRFTRHGLRYLCERAGLEVVYIEAMASYWVTAAQRFCDYLNQFDRFRLIKPLLPLVWFLVQAIGGILDRLHRVESETWNYIVVARKPVNA